MPSSVNHEEALVKAFIPSHQQERFLEIIPKPKKRTKLLSQLYHFDDFYPKFKVEIPPNQHHSSGLLKILKAKGAGSKCYVMSTISELDRARSGFGNCAGKNRRQSGGDAHLMRTRKTGIL